MRVYVNSIYFAKGSFGCIERTIMPKRTQVAKEVAKQFKEKGIIQAPGLRAFDSLGLGIKAGGVRRLWGSFRRGMRVVFNEVSKLPVEAPKAKSAPTPPKRKVSAKPVQEQVNDSKNIKDAE